MWKAFLVVFSCTWNVDAIVFDVHLMKASLGRSIFHSDSAVFVVGDVWLGHFPGGHSNIA